VTPPLRVRVEYGTRDMTDEEKHKLKDELSAQIRDQLRVNPHIELVPPRSLPREAGKTSLIEIREK
jgi:phenylacetate-coenzyme A ligase PaaK-like adenylate-forming protein